MDESCEWKNVYNFQTVWDIECEQESVTGHTPQNNGYKYCPYCGKPLVVEDEQ